MLNVDMFCFNEMWAWYQPETTYFLVAYGRSVHNQCGSWSWLWHTTSLSICRCLPYQCGVAYSIGNMGVVYIQNKRNGRVAKHQRYIVMVYVLCEIALRKVLDAGVAYIVAVRRRRGVIRLWAWHIVSAGCVVHPISEKELN